MISFPLPPWPSLVFAVAATAFSSSIQSAPLSFAEAMRLAEQNAPTLAAQNARLDAARHAVMPAGELPDPKLVLGLDNLPITGPDRFSLTRESMTMQRIGMMQEIPNRGKRNARTAVAQSNIARIDAERRVERLKVLRETALAWISLYTVEQKLALFDALYRENRLLAEAVRSRLASGSGLALDTVLPRQEAAALEERHDQLERERDDAQAALIRWIGPAGAEPLTGVAPVWPITPATFLHRLHQHPELAIFAPERRQAEAQVRETEAAKQPDWAVELAYQRRGPDYSDMASVQLSFDLPVFAGRRQDPLIAAKRAELVRIEAEREAALREHTQVLTTDLAEYRQLDRAALRQRERLMPLAQEKVELALAAYRNNQTELAAVIAARSEWIDARLKAIDLEGQRALTAARLHYAYEENAYEENASGENE